MKATTIVLFVVGTLLICAGVAQVFLQMAQSASSQAQGRPVAAGLQQSIPVSESGVEAHSAYPGV